MLEFFYFLCFSYRYLKTAQKWKNDQNVIIKPYKVKVQTRKVQVSVLHQ